MIAEFQRQEEDPRHARPFFTVGFRDGRIRIVYPDPHDPLRFDEQIYHSSGALVRLEAAGKETELFPRGVDRNSDEL
jgi:hypothetical protein